MKRNIIILSALCLLCSCSGFLDEIPKGNVTTESYYKTEQHAISATNAIYDYLIIGYAPNGLWDKHYGGVFFNDYWVLQDLFSDNSHSNIVNVDFQSIDNMQIDQYNQSVELLWRDFYQVIKACNVVLDKVPAINMDGTLKNHLLAEARFFRGMMYFDLIRMFGDVPLREHNVESTDEEVIPRTSKEKIYELIFSDLTIAEQDLKYQSRCGGGRPYPLSASALLARVYLTYAAEHKDNASFEKAIAKANSVIPSFPMMGKYSDLFKLSNRFNSEIIMGINFSNSLSAGWKGSQYNIRLLPPNLDSSMGAPENAQGWESGTDNLYASYSPLDNRRDATLQRKFVYNNGTEVGLPKAYFFKYWDREAEPRGNNSDAIFPVLRTAEMYLIIAEALNEIHQGPTLEAVNAMKEIRDRAGLNSNSLPTDYAGFKKVVLDEYRHEFAMEGHRWFDLTRMCTADEFISIIKAAKPDATPKAIHFKFPIPQRERELSQGVLTQNEGY